MTGLVQLLREGRRRELAQALFYRLLAADAEASGDEALAERLNELLADEQHHVSRLTARILELGERPSDEATPGRDVPGLEGWEDEARAREGAEVAWYEEALRSVADEATAAILREILEAERNHHRVLAGKWMSAGTGHIEREGDTK